MDYDKTKSCHITVEQFRRVMKETKLIPPSEELFQLLLRKYLDKSNIREINYFSFCADIDKPSDLNAPHVPKNKTEEAVIMHGQLRDAGNTYFDQTTLNMDIINNRFQQKRIETANNPSDVEQRLQAAVVMKRVRIEEFFNDFDKLRKGNVLKNQLQTILSMLNFRLTQEEFESLANKYKTNDPECRFNYRDFCANINSAFTTYGIQKCPLAQVSQPTNDQTILARKKYLEMNEEECEQIKSVLIEIQKVVQIKRIHLKQICQDFDITKNQHITKH